MTEREVRATHYTALVFMVCWAVTAFADALLDSRDRATLAEIKAAVERIEAQP